MRVLRAGDHLVMPWKNGGGATTQIALAPEGAGLEGFDWRVSMARVSEDGPFSAFPGIDRTLAVLDGAGIVLEIEGRAPCEVTADGAPAAFPGDAATIGRLIDGPIADLNVMSVRGRVAHRLTRRTVEGETSVGPWRGILLMLATTPGLTVEGVPLARFDAVLFEASSEAVGTVRVEGAGTCYLVELWDSGDGIDG